MASSMSYQNYHRPLATPADNFNFTNNRPRPTQDIDHYYNLENAPKEKTFVCETCNASFFTHFMFKKHVNEHVQCPFPECKLTANMKVIDQHITHQHMMVNFEALQIDDEAWIAQRKKQFPSVERAQLRMAEQLERSKRGERLGKDKKKFSKAFSNKKGNSYDKTPYRKRGSFDKGMKGNMADLGNRSLSKFKKENDAPDVTENTTYTGTVAKKSNFKETHNKSEFRNKNFNETLARSKKDEALIPASDAFDSDSDDSDPENKFGIPAFKGTRFLFENTGEISLFGVQASDSAIGQHSSMDISDEEDWDNNLSSQVQEPKITFSNALGSLIGAYGSGSDSELDEDNGKASDILAETKQGSRKADSFEMHKRNTDQFAKVDADSMKLNTTERKDNFKKQFGKRKRRHFNNSSKRNNGSRDLNQHSKANFNASKPYRRRYTLLEKLLKPDIVHERNVILQCIRYIVENNFFDPSPIIGNTNDVDNGSVDKLEKLELPSTSVDDTNHMVNGPVDKLEKLELIDPVDKFPLMETEDNLSLEQNCEKLSLNVPVDGLS